MDIFNPESVGYGIRPRQVGASPFADMWHPIHDSGGGIGVASPIATGGARIEAWPYLERNGGNIDAYSFRVSAGAAGNVRVGIYANIGDHLRIVYPGALVFDSGNVDVTAAGHKVINASLALSANTLYWFVIATGAVPTVRCASTPSPAWGIFGLDSTLQFPRNFLGAAFAFGALPNPFPAGAALG